RTLLEGKSHSDRVGERENVREEDRWVQRKALKRLQGDFGRERRRFTQGEEASRAAPRFVVLGKVAPRLAHQPHRRVRGRLPEQGPYQRVVLQRRHRLRASSSGG